MSSKYPIILLHGIMLKDILFIKSFGNINKYLTKQGYSVYVSQHDGLGSIETNAQQIKDFILEILKKENTFKVNIIAHSKGGLDARYMISKLDMGDKVASLTTLSTPHYGSKMANKILSLPNFLKNIIAFWMNFYYRLFKDKYPNAIKMGEQLTSDYLIKFNKEIIDDERVYYQSYYTTLNRSRDDFVMGIPLVFSKCWEKENSDGMVSITSSIWGVNKGNAINDSISHSQIVDFMVNKKKKDKIYTFYLNICKELEMMGF